MFGDIFVRFESLISENQKFLKSDFPIEKSRFLNLTSLSIGSALLFLKSEIEKSGLGHFSAA